VAGTISAPAGTISAPAGTISTPAATISTPRRRRPASAARTAIVAVNALHKPADLGISTTPACGQNSMIRSPRARLSRRGGLRNHAVSSIDVGWRPTTIRRGPCRRLTWRLMVGLHRAAHLARLRPGPASPRPGGPGGPHLARLRPGRCSSSASSRSTGAGDQLRSACTHARWSDRFNEAIDEARNGGFGGADRLALAQL
jgi:hypothetical protein